MMDARRLAVRSKLLIAASLVLTAYFSAQGLRGMRARAKPDSLRSGPSVARVAPSARQTSADAEAIARGILARNIFDSSGGPIAWDVEQDEPAPEEAREAQDQGTERVACPPDLQLLGVVASNASADRSVGLFRRDGVSQLARRGHAVGDAELLALGPSQAQLRNVDGSLCLLSLFAAANGAPPPTPPPAPVSNTSTPAKSKKAPLFSAEELESGVVALGSDRFRIARSLVERGLIAPGRVAKGVKFAPETQHGSVVGVRITRARSDSLLYRLGLREGDLLRSVNGVSVDGMDAMLSVYALFKEQSNLTLALTRLGQPRHLHYAFE